MGTLKATLEDCHLSRSDICLSHRWFTPSVSPQRGFRPGRRGQDGASPGGGTTGCSSRKAARGSASSLHRGARGARGRAASLPPAKAFPVPTTRSFREEVDPSQTSSPRISFQLFNNLRLEVLKLTPPFQPVSQTTNLVTARSTARRPAAPRGLVPSASPPRHQVLLRPDPAKYGVFSGRPESPGRRVSTGRASPPLRTPPRARAGPAACRAHGRPSSPTSVSAADRRPLSGYK